MSNDVWKGGKGAWTTAGNWTSGVPTSTSSVTINSGEPVVTSAITIAALNNFGSLDFLHAGASKISGAVVNAGFFNIDNRTATGGTSLTVLGAFTNTGYLQVGYSDNSLTAADTIKVASLVNSIGEIDLNGGITSAKSVVLDVTGAAGAGFGVSHVVTGTISLSGFSTLEFQTGQFSQIASGATLDLQGPHAFVADASKLNANSALGGLNLVAGTLRISDGATITTNQAMNNINQIAVSTNGGPAATLVIGGQLETSGTVYVDVGGLGGSAVTVQGAVINDNIFDIGSSGLRRSTTVTAKRFVNYGDLVVASALPTAALSLLDIAGAAGFGQAGVLQGRVTLSGNAEIQFDSGQITSIAREGELDLFGKTARIADASSPGGNSALGGLRDVGGTLNLASGNVLATGALTIDQFGEVDVDTAFDFGGQGGSSLTVNGAVKNFGDFNLGGFGLTTGSQTVVNAFTNMGRLVVNGSFEAPERALLTVKSAAGFGVAGHVTGYVDVEGDASIQFASGLISTIDADATLQLYGPQATVSDLSGPTTNSALGGLANVTGTLQIDDGVKIANAANLVVGGDLLIDTIFGGSVLTVKQTLTNNGEVTIGNSGLDRTSQVSAAALHNNGSLFLIGGTAASDVALLKVASAAGFGAAGHLTGFVSLAGRSRIQFTGNGSITNINVGAGLSLDGATAVIANATSATTNSALAALARNDGVLQLADGAKVATKVGLNNRDMIEIDSTFFPKVAGGSTLTVGGVLTNGGTLSIGAKGNTAGDTVTATGLVNTDTISLFGASGGAQAVVNITGAAGFGATGVLTGTVDESGFAAIHFASGQIHSIASEATLDLEGAHAFVSEGAVAGNSALGGLTSVAGDLQLDDGAKVSTTGALSVSGSVVLDSTQFGAGGGAGGSRLTVGGALTVTNAGRLNIGNSEITQAVIAASSLLANAGVLNLAGGGSAAARAELDVSGAAGSGTAGVLSGSISLSGHSALRFGSGVITALASSASLVLDGANAIIATGTATTSTALKGLSNIAGRLTMDNGANFSTTGALGLSGQVQIDTGFNNFGGSKITVGGALTNAGFNFSIGNEAMTKTSQVIATSFVNNGSIFLNGGSATTAQALINISGAAGFGSAGVLQGTVNLSGHSAIEFGSGQITSIQSGASLSLDGAHAFIEKGATNSNSGLTGLGANAGFFSIQNGAVVTPSGAFTNSDLLYVDNSGTGGSQFKVGGLLTNNFGITVGNSQDTSKAFMSAGSLTNNSFIDLNGAGPGANAELDVSGSVVNNGQFNISNDTEILKGAVTGTNGFFNLSSGSTLEFDGAVGSGQTVAFSGADRLVLADASAFAAAISGFAVGDSVDLTTFGTGTTHSFSGGVLTLHSGAKTAHLAFNGSAASDFSITSSAAGTIIAHT